MLSLWPFRRHTRKFEKPEPIRLPYSAPISGVIIWMSNVRARREDPFRYDYFVDFAVATSPFASLDECFAVTPFIRGFRLDLAPSPRIRVYDGTQTEPDPLIVRDCQPIAPSYHGVPYVMFDDFWLAPYNQRVPEIWFPSKTEMPLFHRI